MKPDFESTQISAFVDGEMGLAQQLDMEARLEQDPALRAEVERVRQLRARVREAADYHAAPPGLLGRMQALGGTAPAKPNWQRWLAWRPFGLALALAGSLAWGIGTVIWQSGHGERLMQEAIASHVRATLGQRLVDVASSDQHTVKPWLSSRLDFSPPVHELQAQGVVFLGGRVDYLDGHPVAALVYKKREHVVDAFVWPTQASDSVVHAQSQRGFNAKHWVRGGMSYWVVSDLNQDELALLAQALDR